MAPMCALSLVGAPPLPHPPTLLRAADLHLRGQINTTYGQRHLQSSQGLGYKVQRPLSTGHSILISIWQLEHGFLSPFLFTHLPTVPPNQTHLAGRATAEGLEAWEVQPWEARPSAAGPQGGGQEAGCWGVLVPGQGCPWAGGSGRVASSLIFCKSLKILRKINYISFLTTQCLSRCF